MRPNILLILVSCFGIFKQDAQHPIIKRFSVGMEPHKIVQTTEGVKPVEQII